MSEERNLSSLRGSERIRLRPSVILGSDGIRGVQQTLFEVISNSIDRFKKGYGDKVIITRYKDNSFCIEDFADGLPCLWNEEEQGYNWDIALKTLYGGDNYVQSDDLDGTLGNFGLGLTSTMYSSEYMNVIIHKDKYTYTLNFKEGRTVDKKSGEYVGNDDNDYLSKHDGDKVLLRENNTDGFTGTKITYKPDLKVFTDINVPSEWIQNKLNKQAMVNMGLELIFIDELENKTFTYKYNSLKQYIESIIDNNSICDIIEFSNNSIGRDSVDKDEYKMDYTIALTFSNSLELQEYYHNSSELTELNYNVTTQAVKNGLTSALHEYIKNNKLYGKNEKLKFSDIEDSLICVLSSRSTKTSYANQTKLSIDNKYIKEFITNDLKDKLQVYFTENAIETNLIINQCLINMRANDKASKTKMDIKNKLQGVKKGIKPKVEGLRDCDMRNSTLEERIFLVDEGISANSTIVDAFDNRIMGALGLRGRFINSLKSSVKDVINNQPAFSIIQALGCGIEVPKKERKHFKDIDTFDKSNLRYGSIGLLCDADAFGHGINLSLLTFFYKFMPTLVKEGRIYIVMSPRYEITTKKGEVKYAYNENEKNKIISQLNKNDISSIGIKKGLGEFDKDEFWEYVLSPEARQKSFIQVKYDERDSENIDYYFNMLMGDDIENRKKFIRDRIVNVNLNELE